MRTINPHYAMALKEIRAAATVACWIIGLALMAQVIIWSLLTFTDLRYADIQAASPSDQNAQAVLTADEIRVRQARTARGQDFDGEPVDINHQFSTHNGWMSAAANVAGAIGTMGALALLPLIMLGVILAAGSATDGVEKTSGAFVWSVVLLALCVPWATWFEQVPLHGLFGSYASLTENVETYRAAEANDELGLGAAVMFFGRHALLPIAALLGVTAIGLRFRAGVEAGLMPREDLRLDPELEKEISKIKAGSLVGGSRGAAALRGVVVSKDDDPDAKKLGKQEPMPSIRQPTPGTPLSRPI